MLPSDLAVSWPLPRAGPPLRQRPLLHQEGNAVKSWSYPEAYPSLTDPVVGVQA